MTARTYTLEEIHARCEEYGDCLLWTGAKTDSGYPRVHGSYAHIQAWQAVHGPKPPGRLVRRVCDERLCCNVGHMELMTRHRQGMLASQRGSWHSPARIAAITRIARARFAKLDAAKAATIRASDEMGTVLAVRYGVSRSTISKVRLGKAWAPTAANASVFTMRA